MAGSFRLPRFGTGARKGASVSINMRSDGIFAATSRIGWALGKVILPAKETRKFMSIACFACPYSPAKQCSTPPSPVARQCSSSSAKASSQALVLSAEARQWIRIGSLWAAAIFI